MTAQPTFRYPGNVRGTFGQQNNKKRVVHDTIIPIPIHPALYPKMSAKETEQYHEAQRRKRSRLEKLVQKACDAEDNELYSFHPHLTRDEAAQCYALLENLPVPNEDSCPFYREQDLIYRTTGDIVAGPFGTILFDLEPDAEVSNFTPQVEVKRKIPIKEFIFE